MEENINKQPIIKKIEEYIKQPIISKVYAKYCLDDW